MVAAVKISLRHGLCCSCSNREDQVTLQTIINMCVCVVLSCYSARIVRGFWFAVQAVAELMYDTALVTSGFSVDNPREFAQRIYSMVGLAVNADPTKADAAAAASSSAEPVQAEVVDPNDPWKSGSS